MVYLADQTEPKTNESIAAVTRVPTGYLAKVMQSLSRSKLVNAQRGQRGGFTLAFPANEITVLKVINAVDPIRRFHECPLGLHGINLCPLHRSLDDAARAVERTFGDTTVADLINVPLHRRPLCGFPSLAGPTEPQPSILQPSEPKPSEPKPSDPKQSGVANGAGVKDQGKDLKANEGCEQSCQTNQRI